MSYFIAIIVLLSAAVLGQNNQAKIARVPTPSASILIFDPPTLNLQNALKEGQTISVRLAKKPTRVVKVNLDTPKHVQIDKCAIQFTPNNFDKAQVLTAFASGALFSSTNAKKDIKESIIFHIFDSCENLKGSIQSYDVFRKYQNAATCSVSGDPHYNTFDNSRYSFFGKNQLVYYVMKNPRTTIQARHSNKCHPDHLCGSELAVRFHDSVLTIRVDPSSPKNKDPVVKIDSAGPKGNIELSKIDKFRLKVTLSDGVFIKVTFGRSRNAWILNFVVTVPGFYANTVDGLCGDFNGKPDKIDGNSHLVPTSDNIFICKNKCAGAPAPPKIRGNVCKSVPPPLLHCIPKNNTTPTPPPPKNETVVYKYVDVVVPPQVCPEPKQQEPPVDYCTRVFSRKCPNVDTNYYIQACIRDAEQELGLKDTADALLQTYLEECASSVTVFQESPQPEDQQVAKQIITENAFQAVAVDVKASVNVSTGAVVSITKPSDVVLQAGASASASASAFAQAQGSAEAGALIGATASSEASASAIAESNAGFLQTFTASAEAEASAKAQAEANANAQAEASAKAQAEANANAQAFIGVDSSAQAQASANAFANSQIVPGTLSSGQCQCICPR